jgi:hypothetical protein
MAPKVNRRTLIFLDFLTVMEEVRAQRALVESRKRRSVQGIARFGLAVVAGSASGTKHVKGLQAGTPLPGLPAATTTVSQTQWSRPRNSTVLLADISRRAG